MSLDSVPETSVSDYLLEPAETEEEEEEKEGEKADNDASKGKTKASNASERRSSLVIFAVDVSGSMSSTTTVPELQGNGDICRVAGLVTNDIDRYCLHCS